MDLVNVTDQRLLEIVNRGCLAHPTTYCYSACVTVFLLYCQISCNDNRLDAFLKKGNHLRLFASAVCEFCNEMTESTRVLTAMRCSKGHNVFQQICRKLFNTFSKNELKRLNNETEVNATHSSVKSRKITKLQCGKPK